MNTPFAKKVLRLAGVVATTILVLMPASQARQQSAGPNLNVAGNEMEERMELSNMDALGDKDEVAAYQKFSKAEEASKKIELGSKFLQKYPKSALAERVDAGLMNVYRAQQDWKDSYRCADSALALDPDDVDVLTTVGWTIPHLYNPSDPDADQELNTAETYAKHAIEVLAKLPKPAGLTDEQFAAAKTRRTFQAHSALGLVYFRREDYEHSASELEQSTTGNPIQDPTDLFVLGVDLQNLNRHSEAAAAFRGCSQVAGVLQNQCKQNADLAQAQVDQAKSK
jgi:tetratricopeptide (TPR) repeat protein